MPRKPRLHVAGGCLSRDPPRQPPGAAVRRRQGPGLPERAGGRRGGALRSADPRVLLDDQSPAPGGAGGRHAAGEADAAPRHALLPAHPPGRGPGRAPVRAALPVDPGGRGQLPAGAGPVHPPESRGRRHGGGSDGVPLVESQGLPGAGRRCRGSTRPSCWTCSGRRRGSPGSGTRGSCGPGRTRTWLRSRSRSRGTRGRWSPRFRLGPQSRRHRSLRRGKPWSRLPRAIATASASAWRSWYRRRGNGA